MSTNDNDWQPWPLSHTVRVGLKWRQIQTQRNLLFPVKYRQSDNSRRPNFTSGTNIETTGSNWCYLLAFQQGHWQWRPRMRDQWGKHIHSVQVRPCFCSECGENPSDVTPVEYPWCHSAREPPGIPTTGQNYGTYMTHGPYSRKHHFWRNWVRWFARLTWLPRITSHSNNGEIMV